MKNKSKKKILLGLGCGLVASAAISSSLIATSTNTSSIQQAGVVTPTPAPFAAPSDSGVKSIKVAQTPPFAPDNGYKAGTEVVFTIEVIMQNPHEVPPNVTSITWTLYDTSNRIINEQRATPWFAIENYSADYQNCRLEVTGLGVDGVDASSKLLEIPPIVLGKSYQITKKDLTERNYVIIISIISVVAFFAILATILGKIGMTYRLDHHNFRK